jgi:hypothetical protein
MTFLRESESVFVYIGIVIGDPEGDGRAWDLIGQFNHVTFVCVPGQLSNAIYSGLTLSLCVR